MKKVVLLAFVLVLLSTAVFVGFVRPAVTQGTIYIRADGSVEGTDKIQRDGNTYTFTDNIYDQIVVQRDNTVIDGAGYAVQGTGAFESKGIDLQQVSNVTIKNATIKGFYYGIHFNSTSYNILSGNNITANEWWGVFFMFSSNNNIVGNNITDNPQGIRLYRSSNNLILGNTIKNSTDGGIDFWISCSNNSVYRNNIANNRNGIWIQESSKNVITGNKIVDNELGIGLDYSSDNKVYHNNFVANDRQVEWIHALIDIWDIGYPSGGNYWSDYNGTDMFSGPDQDMTGSDGIGETSYDIDENNQDNYPLMGMFSDFNATSEQHVQTICNSTISNFQFNGTAISFNVTGENDTTGFCRICIPTALMTYTFRVFVNGTEILPSPEPLPCSNSTHNYLYFTYDHSTQEVVIIPEFPTWTSMLLLLIVLTVAITIYKRKLLKTPNH